MNVLAIGAHPFDIALLSGGTLAKYVREGHRVALLAMCLGDSRYPEFTPARAELRRQEYRDMAAVIGAEAYSLEQRDFRVHNDGDTRLRTIEVMRQVGPKVVLTHDPHEYSGDHRTTGELVGDCLHMSKQPGVRTETPPLSLHPEVICMDTVAGMRFDPEQYVDITEVMPTKLEMIRAFAEEVGEWEHDPVFDTVEWVETHARFRGLQCGVRYAEAFRRPHLWGRMSVARWLP